MKELGPSANIANGGMNRITVPAKPQSMSSAPRNRTGGVTFSESPEGSKATPRACNASIMSCESRESSTPWRVLGPSASAARTRARLVSDLEPGTSMSPVTGEGEWGSG